MATNFVQCGDSISVSAPRDLSSGDGVLIGVLFGIATVDALSGESVNIAREGVFTIPKTSALAISVGDRLFWDDTNHVVNKTATAQVSVGIAVSAAANPSSTVEMLIEASTPAGT